MAIITTASIITIIRGLINDNLQTDGLQAHEYDNDVSFLLEKSYVSSSTIEVYKNGTPLTVTTHYTYNSTTNKITISAALTKGDSIVIAYSYYERFSDSELTTHIKANLVWFTKKRYKKHFYLNSSNEVVTLDGFNPTDEEGNIIALITAISIDPKNINIRTKDFSISPQENKSRTEQIDEVFANFNRSFGSIGFLEDE